MKLKITLQIALVAVLLLWAGYTALYTLLPGENTPADFALFLPGLLGVTLLVSAGLSWRDCYLRPARLSKTGALWLAASLPLLMIVWLSGAWVGWDWLAALVYAPASGISQELFFRAALLPALLAVLPKRPGLAILIHALLFSLWHLPKVALTAPPAGVIAVVVVTFLCGLLWARQVRKDGTVFWLMGFHSIILLVNTLFTWG